MSFFARLDARARAIDSPLCVGLDPRVPPEKIVEECRRIIDATSSLALCYKPNSAFFEQHGPAGLEALAEVVAYVPDGIPVLLDAKRGDIGSTAVAYAASCAYYGVDAVTVSPYLGEDAIRPFADAGLAVFALCRTSNPGSAEFQLPDLADKVATRSAQWQGEIGLVVAGNDPAALSRVRALRGDAWFLAPGIGSQGGTMQDAVGAGLRDDGLGLLAAVSRGISDATDPASAALELVQSFREARKAALANAAAGEPAASESPHPGTPASNPKDAAQTAISASLRRQLLDAIIDTGCFTTGTFTLKSGKTSPFYIDLRRLQSNAEALRTAGRTYAALLAGAGRADRVAGIPVAALPLATALSIQTGVPLIYPRLPPKPHGTGNRIEGEWNAGERVVLVDDLVTTGLSKIEAAGVLREDGLLVTDLIVLIQRSWSNPDLDEAGLRVHAAAHITDLVDRAIQRGGMSSEAAATVRAFLDNEREGA